MSPELCELSQKPRIGEMSCRGSGGRLGLGNAHERGQELIPAHRMSLDGVGRQAEVAKA